MAFPGEDYVYRFHEPGPQPALLHARVLDVGVGEASFYATVLAEWAYGDAGVEVAGFSLIHLDPLGNVKWQLSKTLSVGTERGPWIIQEASLAESLGQHVIAGTAVHATEDFTIMFCIGIDDPEKPGDPPIVRWANHYVLNRTLVPPPLRLSSITTTHAAGGTYLMSVYHTSTSWLIEIFQGSVRNSWEIESARIHRLRLTAGEGILGVGSYWSNSAGILMSFDSSTFKLRWAESYNNGSDPYPLRWTDVAEGATSLLVIGHLFDGSLNEVSPMMASLTTGGGMKWAAVPTLGDVPVRLRRVSSHRDVVVGVSPFPETAAFTISGDATQQPWMAVLGEDHAVQWQKFFRTVPPLTGSLESVSWATYDQILTGGSYTVGSGIPRGLYAASRSVVGRGTKRCGVQANVMFPEVQLEQHGTTDFIYGATFTDYALVLDDGPPLAVVPGCIVDDQG